MHIGFKIVGTFLLGGALLNYIIPAVMVLFAFNNNENNNDYFFVTGGKIGRQWYFILLFRLCHIRLPNCKLI